MISTLSRCYTRLTGAVRTRLGRRGKILLAIVLGTSSVLLLLRAPTAVAEARSRAGLWLLDWPSEDVRRAAFEELEAHPSEHAVPGLVELLDDDKELAYRASRCLESFGELAVVPLADALRDGDRVTRFWAARTLGSIGRDAAAALPAVVAALHDPEPGVRHNALYAIETVDPATAVLELTAVLTDSGADTTDRIIAMRVLEVIGRSSPAALDAFERVAARADDPPVRDVAREVLTAWETSLGSSRCPREEPKLAK